MKNNLQNYQGYKYSTKSKRINPQLNNKKQNTTFSKSYEWIQSPKKNMYTYRC